MINSQLIICGGANGSAYIFDIHLLYTSTFCWTQVDLGTGFSQPMKSIGKAGEIVASSSNNTSDKNHGVESAVDISKRLCPAVFPLSPNEIIIFGGGTCLDFSCPPYDTIPADAYQVVLLPTNQPREFLKI